MWEYILTILFPKINPMRKSIGENTKQLMSWLEENDSVLREAKKIK